MLQVMTRRGFAAGLAGCALAAPARMRFGFTTYTWGARWDISTLIANCAKAGAYGVELRTTMNYAHGVERTLSAAGRLEVRKRFESSPVKLVGLACGERFDSPDPAKLAAAIETAKDYVKLAAATGAPGLRVFPNDWQKNVPRERTIEQIGKPVGALAEDGAFAARFALVERFLAGTLHIHELDSPEEKFPYQLQFDLLARAKWTGWCLVEASSKVPDPVEALIALRKSWESMAANAYRRG